MSFKDFELHASILKALKEMKYDKTTEIQEKVIKPVLAGKNIVGQSQTGTGKTAAFLIPLLQKIDTNKKWLQALIIAPTRELAEQIKEEVFSLTKYHRVSAVCVYGWASQVVQKKNLKRQPNIIVATPGRLLDFMNQKVIDVRAVRFLVLDEVDRMLDMWFIRDIKKIRNQMKNLEQTLTFSATMNDSMKKIINEYVGEYTFVKIWDEITVDKINHSFVNIAHADKMYNLINIIQKHKNEKIIVFTQTKRNTKTISNLIIKAWYNADMLNGDLSQWRRNWTLKRFKDNEIKILVTTDVAARWLNMDNVHLVINFETPKESDSYIHRIWRTGRAGAEGKAIMFVSKEEQTFLTDIEKIYNTKIKQSDYMTIIDTSLKFSTYKLDKSTDKFGGGRWRWTPRIARPNSQYGWSKKPFKKDKKKGFWRREWSKSEDRKYFGSKDKNDKDSTQKTGTKRPFRGSWTSYKKKPGWNFRHR